MMALKFIDAMIGPAILIFGIGMIIMFIVVAIIIIVAITKIIKTIRKRKKSADGVTYSAGEEKENEQNPIS